MGNLGLVNVALWCALVACALVDNKVQCAATCDVDISETLRTLLNPQDNDSIQVQALRRHLLRRLQEDLNVAELEDGKTYKRYMTAPGRWNDFPDEHKRNLESLARAGTWYKNPPLPDDYKRSTTNLPYRQTSLIPDSMENEKRSIEALARNGELHRHQNFQDYQALLENLYEKRNVASLARNFNYPNQGIGKRSISSLAKTGELPNVYGKRNIQSLARDGLLGKKFAEFIEAPQDKRNIQSIKAQQRNKRQADYFSNEIVYQMPVDYEDVVQDLEAAEQNIYPLEDKRFLGRLPQMGKPRTTAIPKSHRYH